MAIRKACLLGAILAPAAGQNISISFAPFGEDPRDATCMVHFQYWEMIQCGVFENEPLDCGGSRLFGAEEECGASGCKVRVNKIDDNMTCGDYCLTQGFDCSGAWTSVGDEDCQEGGSLTCNSTAPDGLICECSATANTPLAQSVFGLQVTALAPYCYQQVVSWVACMDEHFEENDKAFLDYRVAEVYPVGYRAGEASFVEHEDNTTKPFGEDPRDASCSPHYMMWSEIGCKVFEHEMAQCNGAELYMVDAQCGDAGCKVDIGEALEEEDNATCEEYCHHHGLECDGGWSKSSDDECAEGPSVGCNSVGAHICACTGFANATVQLQRSLEAEHLAPYCMQQLKGYTMCLEYLYEPNDPSFYWTRYSEVEPLILALGGEGGDRKCIKIPRHVADEIDAMHC